MKKRFGDEELIATKLINELKALNIVAKSDHEKIINLVIKVRSLVTRLDAIGASEALKYDGEFVTVIYFQLPGRSRQDWLKFDKSLFKDKWAAIIAFLEDSYEKLLLASYTTTAKDGPGQRKATNLASTTLDNQAHSDKEEKQRKALEEARSRVGKCPVCKLEHTFKTKWSTVLWPSDIFVTCKKFGDMTNKQSAETLEKVKGCPRCTSWGHNKQSCKLPVQTCK